MNKLPKIYWKELRRLESIIKAGQEAAVEFDKLNHKFAVTATEVMHWRKIDVSKIKSFHNIELVLLKKGRKSYQILLKVELPIEVSTDVNGEFSLILYELRDNKDNHAS